MLIPPSYFYKDIYRQTWLDPDIEAAKARSTSHHDGHRMWRDFLALLTRHTTPHAPHPTLPKLNPIEQ